MDEYQIKCDELSCKILEIKELAKELEDED